VTLVVARIKNGRIAIVADTIITQSAKQLPFRQSCLKTWMFPGNLCVSFCNSPESAKVEFDRFLSERVQEGFSKTEGMRCSFDRTVKFFEESSRRTGNDYIVAFDNPARVLKIVEGARRPSLAHTVWIGDKDAYEAFREYEGNERPKAERGRALSNVLFADEIAESPASSLYSTFRNVISDRSVPEVGGFASVASNRGNGFRFSAYSDMLYDWPSPELKSYNDPIDLSASGENLGYSVAQIAPNFVGVNALAYYYVRSRTLFLYFGNPHGLADRCQIINGVEPSKIKETLDKLFGMDLGWLALVTSSTPHGQPSIRSKQTQGLALSIFVDANTFPPSPKRSA
jgi:hypothetical protein